ncbi:DUF411 domain-containing protein [Longimicrobium sp.]|uniref:DUF411 domain-containing protein n=1 Tax=Longimicrobium sp. TaxID=2029185 RepID=UPI002C3FB2EA|nr:DUF411 domain-containing protein [Longimicrobium sp.]HSU12969.1 DUF411 domain-containing protein [Longimicrobium sp.]
MSSIPFGRTLFRGALAAVLATAAAACGGSNQTAQKSGGDAAPAGSAAVPADAPLAVVYKSPTCGCCNNWVKHMQDSGFRVETHDQDNVDPVKDEAGVPQAMRSCHTAKIGGYAIEGHVPADVIRQLLREHPADIVGLAVPGMVTGSPGMEGPNPQHYDVVAFTKDGQTRVYASR